MNQINLGHGNVRMENGQLVDDLSRLWCACGQPAVQYVADELPQYQFRCVGHKEDKANE